jgi:hypothetical protein
MRRLAALLLAIATAALMPSTARAHKPSDSYLSLSVGNVTIAGEWKIALRDLDYAIGLDSNDDGAITWGELREHHAAIAAYALARLRIDADAAACSLRPLAHLVDSLSDGAYEVLRFAADCPQQRRTLTVAYHLLFDVDPLHRGLLSLTTAAGVQTVILSPGQPRVDLDVAAGPRHNLLGFLVEGITHVWSGYDHVLFMAVMLLPAMLLRRDSRWQPAPKLVPALLDTFRIVTAFTLAHATALTLALFGYISLPSRLVESAVALSIVLTALDNFRAVLGERRWLLAFCFGLVHGSGYAGTLAGLALPAWSLAAALVGFNLGVEIAQLTVAVAVFPIGFLVRHRRLYIGGVLPAGSAAAIAVSGLWFVERAFNVLLIPR